MMRALLFAAFLPLAAVCLLLFSASNASAQNVQTAECSKGCNFAANPGDAQTTSCLLSGVPGTSSPIAKPVIPRAQVPATSRDAAMTDPTCWWPGIVIAPGAYSLTAAGKADDGRISIASSPLSLTVSAIPLGAPSAPRAVP